MLPWSPSPGSSRRSRKSVASTVGADEDNVPDKSVPINRNSSSTSLWRRGSNIINLNRSNSTVYESSPSPTLETEAVNSLESKQETALVLSNAEPFHFKRVKDVYPGTVVSIVIVEAKGLPDPPADGNAHSVYCKIKLGSQTYKSKSVVSTLQPRWEERFHMRLLKDPILRVSLWDKGKRKTFMGNADLDLLHLETERTHELWQPLNDGYGLVHLAVTICSIKKNVTGSLGESSCKELQTVEARPNPSTDWKLVGQLVVKVIAAKGLNGKPNAYCSLEVDNERVRTHTARGSSEPLWNQTFMFNVYDVTSTLDIKIYDSSLMTSIHNESLGRLSIPLLRIENGSKKWYAFKDKSKRNGARGNCPRVLLETSLVWNPIKASVRVFQPKEVKYIRKSPKFDIALVYKNMEFVRDTFVSLYEINESYKRFLEWENQEISFIVLIMWLLFWYHFKPWATPLLLLLPFFYFWICNRHQSERSFLRGYGIVESSEKDGEIIKSEKSLTGRITELPEMTLTITNGVNYLAALTEKLYNLASFKIPFLSYLTIILLIISAFGFYIIPFNCMMMGFGIYKFSRKYMKPDRVPNNDMEDFLSRIPDTEQLRDWKELSVPEPSPQNGITVGPHPYIRKGSTMY